MQLPFPIHSVAWQHLVVLLYALNEVGGEPTKDAVINLIRERAWLKYRPGDHLPYPTQNEESWKTDIAWSRKAGVIAGLVRFDDWNCWEISRDGRIAIQKLLVQYQETIDLRQCFLWTDRFKRVFDRTFEASQIDRKAPPKGERAPIPDVRRFQETLDLIMPILLETKTLPEIAQMLTQNFGFFVSPNPKSIATALALRELRENFG